MDNCQFIVDRKVLFQALKFHLCCFFYLPTPKPNRITACPMFTKLKFFFCSIICQPLLLSLSASLDRISQIIRGFLWHISNYILGHFDIVFYFLYILLASCRQLEIFRFEFLFLQKLHCLIASTDIAKFQSFIFMQQSNPFHRTHSSCKPTSPT